MTPGECGSSGRGPSRTTRTIPAPTVSFESWSIRMNAPVVRFSAYGSATIGALVRSVSRAMSLSSSWSGGVSSRSVVTSSSTSIDSTAARTVRVVCLSATCSPARSGLSDIQQTVASRWRPATGRSLGADDHLAAADVEVVARAGSVTESGGAADSRGPSCVSTASTFVRPPPGMIVTSSPGRSVPPATWPA